MLGLKQKEEERGIGEAGGPRSWGRVKAEEDRWRWQMKVEEIGDG
jgi:hypothetical protein